MPKHLYTTKIRNKVNFPSKFLDLLARKWLLMLLVTDTSSKEIL